MPSQERRTNPELRRRVDELLSRVMAAREEIVEAGLDAVHDSHGPDEASPTGRFARRRTSGAPAASASARTTHHDG